MFGIGIIFTLGVLNAQTDLSNPGSIFTQDFNGATSSAFSSITPAFTSQNVNGGTTWNIYTTVGTTTPVNIARGGTGACAGYFYDTALPGDDWMFSSALTLKAGQNYRLSHYYATLNATGGPYPERLRMYVGRAAAAAPTATDMLGANAQLIKDYGSFNNTDYVLDEINFTVPTDGTYFMAWYAYSTPDQYILRIDDVRIENVTPVPNDISVMSVTTTATVANCGSFTATTPFTVKVRNTGTNAQTNIPVNFSATRNAVALPAINSQTIPSLAANAEVDLTVNIDASAGGTYILTATSALVGDGNAVNSTRTFTVFNPLADLTAQGSTSSNNFLALAGAGWSVNPTPTGDSGWFLVNIAATGTPANGAMLGARNATTASNDWLFSNCLTLQQNQRYRISYQRAAFNNSNPAVVANAEKLRMFIAGANTPASMTATTQVLPLGVTAVGDETFTNTVLTTVTYEYIHTSTTGVYYVGIQHTSDAAPAGFPTATSDVGILIDNFSIVAMPNADLAMRRLMPPFPDACGGFSATTPITTRVWNAGTQPINTDNFVFKYRVRDASASNAVPVVGVLAAPTTFIVPSTTIAVGDSLTLPAFNVDMSLPRYYVVDVFIDSPSTDGNKLNDTLRVAFTNSYRNLAADNAVYLENFDTSSLNLSWTTINQGATGSSNWGFGGNATLAASGANYFFIPTNTTVANNSSLFSPCLNLASGKVYTLGFKYRTNAGNEKLRVVLVNARTTAAITAGTVIRDYPTLNSNGSYTTAPNESFVVPTTGIYYIVFQNTSDLQPAATAGSTRIDDVVITNTGSLQPPAAPATLTATAAPLQVDLSWTASTSTGVTAPTSYRVDFSTTDANTGFTSLPVVNAPATTFSHLNLTAGTVYFYRVYATNSAGTSTLFAAGSATPAILAAPTNLVIATQTTANALTLNWTASPTATGYDIERATVTGGTPGAYTSVGTPSNTSFNNTGLITGTVYAYRVRASKGTPLQYSAYSNVVTSAAVLELDQTAFGKQIVVSPNPTDGNFKVDMRNVKPNRVTFIITDLNGKEVHRSVGENEDSFDFNVTGVSKGTYLLYINADKGQSVKKVVIK